MAAIQSVQRKDEVKSLVGEYGQVIVDECHHVPAFTFERVLKARAGIAVAKAANGHCTICHVRLRPQVFNTILRNESIIQCDSCQRILYYVPPPPPAEGAIVR